MCIHNCIFLHVCVCVFVCDIWDLGKLSDLLISAVTEFTMDSLPIASALKINNQGVLHFTVGRQLCFNFNIRSPQSGPVFVQTAEGGGKPSGRWSERGVSSLSTKLLKCLCFSKWTCGITASQAIHYTRQRVYFHMTKTSTLKQSRSN